MAPDLEREPHGIATDYGAMLANPIGVLYLTKMGARLPLNRVDEELLLRNEYLATENEILRSKLGGRPRLTNSERIRLAKLGKRLGLTAPKDVCVIVKPETIS